MNNLSTFFAFVGLLLISSCWPVLAQNDADPALIAFSIGPDPILKSGAGLAQLNVTNTGIDSPIPAGQFSVQISFPTSYLPEPQSEAAIIISAQYPASSLFTWSYNAATRTLRGISKVAIAPGGGGIVGINLKGITVTFPAYDNTIANIQLEGDALGIPNDDPDNNSLAASARVQQGPLPVSLINFTASWEGNQGIRLLWETAWEKNSDHFDIQRSLDAREFGVLDKLQAKGEASQQQRYSYLDIKPLLETAYYRLRIVDRDGQYEYSKIVAVSSKGDEPSLRLAENPVNGHYLRVWVTGYELTDLKVSLVTGQSIPVRAHSQPDGSVWLEVAQPLATGIYVVSAGDGSTRQSVRAIVK